jgi:aminoglycoside phosphotransferase (APT) family kinase protein
VYDWRALAAPLSLNESTLTITPLTGGVSSDIMLLDDGRQRLVAKRALPQLKVAQHWPCHPSRIFREIDALRLLAPVCPVPEIVYEDRANFLYVMSAAPPDAEPWKARLLRGDASPALAQSIGEIHAVMLAQNGFDDPGFFEELRIDPYYTFTAAQHPDLAEAFHRATQACRQTKSGLVHGDWSPKNILTTHHHPPLALDFECIHRGDPAYDAAFLLNHLLLKTFHQPPHWAALKACAEAYMRPLANIPFAAVLIHLPLLLLARMDGKSPIEYIHEREPVRQFARALLAHPPANPTALWQQLRDHQT